MDVVGDPPWGPGNAWLTTGLLREGGPEPIIDALAARQIEARHVWKPMHLQSVFAEAPAVGGSVAEDLFARGICLPSGQGMTDYLVGHVASVVTEDLAPQFDRGRGRVWVH